MEPWKLVRRLVEEAGGTYRVAKAMNRPTFQGTLHRIVAGQTIPTRQSAERIAAFFRLPVDALYDPAVAERVSKALDRDQSGAIADVASVTGSPPEPVRAQVLSLYEVTVRPVALTWDALVTAKDLPPLFEVSMPDDALAPDARAGTVLLFTTEGAALPLRPRTGILVQDASGRRYIRRYAEAAGGRWQAQALDSAYVTLDSDRDGLQLLAVMKGRMDPLI